MTKISFCHFFPSSSFHISAQSTGLGLVLTILISLSIFFRIWMAFNCLLNCLKISFLISKSSTPLCVKVQSFSKHLTPNLHGNLVDDGLKSSISAICSVEVRMISSNNCLSGLSWWWTQRQLTSVQKEVNWQYILTGISFRSFRLIAFGLVDYTLSK